MAISEQELRGMIREAIARHGSPRPDHAAAPPPSLVAPMPTALVHCSHGLLALVASGDAECVIEPSVPCDHCGYCKSLGH
jgi:hypothetical protein